MSQKIILEVERDTRPLDEDMLVYSKEKEKYVPKTKSNILTSVTKRFVTDEEKITELEEQITDLKKNLNALTAIVKEINENV